MILVANESKLRRDELVSQKVVLMRIIQMERSIMLSLHWLKQKKEMHHRVAIPSIVIKTDDIKK